jgi:intraflagellar transport protein 122
LYGEIVFNIARFLLNIVGTETPVNINRFYVLFALAKHSRELGAFKLARYAYDKLQQIRLPTTSWIDKLDLETLSVRAKAFSDKEVKLIF